MFILIAMLLLVVSAMRFMSDLIYDEQLESIAGHVRTLYSILNASVFGTSLTALGWLIFSPSDISVALGFLLVGMLTCGFSFLWPPLRPIDEIIDSQLFRTHSLDKEKK